MEKLHIFCKLTVICDILIHLLICGILMKRAIIEIIFVPFGIAVLMLALLSTLFYIGIIIESDNFMIPMIVGKIILMLIVGIVTLFAWTALILSLFSAIQIESPIKGLSTPAFLGLQSVVMTVCFTVLILEGSILHAEFKHIKRRVEQKHAENHVRQVMNSSKSTIKPTVV